MRDRSACSYDDAVVSSSHYIALAHHAKLVAASVQTRYSNIALNWPYLYGPGHDADET